MNKFYLIRHGEKEKIKGDPSLTSKGKEQAFKTGLFLKNKNIVRIFSSPFKRTRETSEEINKSLNVDIEINERLKERMNWGTIPEQTLEELLVEWDKATRERDYVPAGGISSRQSGSNMTDVLNTITSSQPHSATVIVAHGGIIMDFIRNIASEEKLPELEQTSPEISGRESSITEINFDNDIFEIVRVGSIDHL